MIVMCAAGGNTGSFEGRHRLYVCVWCLLLRVVLRLVCGEMLHPFSCWLLTDLLV